MVVASGPRVSFAAMVAEWHTTMQNAPLPRKSALCVWAASVCFTVDPIKKPVGQPVARGFSALDKDNRQTPTVLPWNGARTRLSRPPSSKNKCRHSLLRQGWSTPGSLPHRKRCASAAPRRLPIKCVLTFLRLFQQLIRSEANSACGECPRFRSGSWDGNRQPARVP